MSSLGFLLLQGDPLRVVAILRHHDFAATWRSVSLLRRRIYMAIGDHDVVTTTSCSLVLTFMNIVSLQNCWSYTTFRWGKVSGRYTSCVIFRFVGGRFPFPNSPPNELYAIALGRHRQVHRIPRTSEVV